MPGGWSGPGKGRGSIGFGGAGSMRHQNIGHQTGKKQPSAAHSGGGARTGKENMGSSRGYKAFKQPANDGNLYTGKSKLKKHDFWGNHQGAAKPSSCFIVTACVEARGLADDCEELAIIRKLRDGYVRQLPEGPALVTEYYEKAPRIVEAIDALPPEERATTYSWVWQAGIEPAVALVREGRCEEALSLYRAICADLQGWLLPETLTPERRQQPLVALAGETFASLAASKSTPTTTEGGLPTR